MHCAPQSHAAPPVTRTPPATQTPPRQSHQCAPVAPESNLDVSHRDAKALAVPRKLACGLVDCGQELEQRSTQSRLYAPNNTGLNLAFIWLLHTPCLRIARFTPSVTFACANERHFAGSLYLWGMSVGIPTCIFGPFQIPRHPNLHM
jgi:hypothetical protein